MPPLLLSVWLTPAAGLELLIGCLLCTWHVADDIIKLCHFQSESEYSR